MKQSSWQERWRSYSVSQLLIVPIHFHTKRPQRCLQNEIRSRLPDDNLQWHWLKREFKTKSHVFAIYNNTTMGIRKPYLTLIKPEKPAILPKSKESHLVAVFRDISGRIWIIRENNQKHTHIIVIDVRKVILFDSQISEQIKEITVRSPSRFKQKPVWPTSRKIKKKQLDQRSDKINKISKLLVAFV